MRLHSIQFLWGHCIRNVEYIEEVGLSPGGTEGIAFEISFLESQSSFYVLLEHYNKRTKYYSALQND